ncbi:RHS repeat domain-containing protein [Roseibium alexandrii]
MTAEGTVTPLADPGSPCSRPEAACCMSGSECIKHPAPGVRKAGSEINWLQRDHLSSVRLMTNAAGAIIAENHFRPYGARTDVQLAAGVPRESKGWIGERDDPETGLTYLNARYYDPVLARFISPDWFDPQEPGVGTNRYAYAGNNPVAFKDPSGNWFEGVFSGPGTYKDSGNALADAPHNLGAAIVNAPASLANLALEGVRQVGNAISPYEGTITNLSMTTPVPLDDVIAAGVKSTVGLASVLPVGKVAGAAKVGKYTVGPYKDMRGRVTGMDAHHVGQKALMKAMIPEYDPKTAPAILVPKKGHTVRKGEMGTVSRRQTGLTNPRSVLARDIMELKRVYPDIPNQNLQQLIDMNKTMYRDAFTK